MNQANRSAHRPQPVRKSSNLSRQSLLPLAAGFASLLAMPAADATLLMGKTVGYQYLWPSQGAVFDDLSFMVGNGVELPALYSGDDGIASVDLTDTDLVVDYHQSGGWNAIAYNGFRIYDINNTLPEFAAVTINAGTNMAGFDAGRVSFDANNIYVNWQGLAYDANTLVALSVTAVPEPSVPLLGMLATGLLLRRRRSA